MRVAAWLTYSPDDNLRSATASRRGHTTLILPHPAGSSGTGGVAAVALPPESRYAIISALCGNGTHLSTSIDRGIDMTRANLRPVTGDWDSPCFPR